MYLREILTGVISTMINNLFKKKSFYKEKKTINVLIAFYSFLIKVVSKLF